MQPVTTSTSKPARYELVTGYADADFNRRVSEALAKGAKLHGPTFVLGNTTIAQAVLWETPEINAAERFAAMT